MRGHTGAGVVSGEAGGWEGPPERHPAPSPRAGPLARRRIHCSPRVLASAGARPFYGKPPTPIPPPIHLD